MEPCTPYQKPPPSFDGGDWLTVGRTCWPYRVKLISNINVHGQGMYNSHMYTIGSHACARVYIHTRKHVHTKAHMCPESALACGMYDMRVALILWVTWTIVVDLSQSAITSSYGTALMQYCICMTLTHDSTSLSKFLILNKMSRVVK